MSTDYNFDLDDMKPDDLMMPSEVDPEDERVNLPFVQFLQPMSTLKGFPKGQGSGYIAIGRNITNEEGKAEWGGVLLEGGEARFWVVDQLTIVPDPNKKFKGKPQRIGARSLWPFKADTGKPDTDKNPDGSTKGITCKSNDGLAPLSSFLSRVVPLPANHPSYPGVAVIGLNKTIQQGQALTAEDLVGMVSAPEMVCRTCPLGQWYEKTTASTNGKKKEWERLCKSKWNFVVYFPPQKANVFTDKAKKSTTGKDLTTEILWEGGLAILQGHSPSVQSALEGDIAGGSVQKTQDGKDIPSLFNFMMPTGVKNVVAPKDEIHASFIMTATAFGTDAEHLVSVMPENINADVVSAMNEESVKVAQLEVKTFPYAQSGHPQIVGKTAGLPGMRYLKIDVVQSAWNNNPFVPFVSVADLEVSEDDYDAWIEAIRFYKGEAIRDQLLLSSNIEIVRERLGNPVALLAASEAAPQLGAGGDVIEASFEDLSDM